jgi:hypothetical protein
MTLAHAARMLGLPPKWIQNALTQLGFPLAYPAPRIRQLGLAHRLAEAGFSLRIAWARAGTALQVPYRPVTLPAGPATVRVVIDVPRYLTEWAAAQSRVLADPPRVPGRPRKLPPRGRAIARARAYGMDLSSLAASLRKTPAERLVALDANQRFIARLRNRPR